MNGGSFWGSALFLVAALIFLGLPFIPMLLEVFRNTDGKPSEIPQNQATDPRRDPEQALWYHVFRLKLSSLEELKSYLRATHREVHPSGILLLPAGAPLLVPVKESHILTYGPLRTARGLKYNSKIVSLTSVDAADEGQFLEVQAQDELKLGRASKVLWWASGKQVWVGRESSLFGKITAQEKIVLGDRVRFQLLDAPTIELGGESVDSRPANSDAASEPVRRTVVRDLAGVVHRTRDGGRVVCAGDVEIPENGEILGDLIVRGRLTIGRGALLRGSVKAHGDLVMRHGAQVQGNVFCSSSILIESRCRIAGAVASEGLVDLREGVRIGSIERPTSVVAQSLRSQGTCRVHGTLRAWKLGEVRA